jgi:probable phosphoglycerate mutase
VLLVRHGETEWSRSRQHTGRTDLPLTGEGRRRAEALRRPLRAAGPFALVLTSPLLRARATANLAGFAAEAQARDDLREWDYGAYEGRTTAAIREERPDWDLWRDGCPDGEQPADVAARVDRVVAELRALDGGRALVFGHSHCLRVLAARWLEQPGAFGRHLPLATAAVSALGYERESPALITWNGREPPVPER